MLEIPLWRLGRTQQSLDTRLLHSYRREPVARVHQSPPILVRPTVEGLRRAAPGAAEEPARRWTAISRAGALLGAATLGGLGPSDHTRLVTLATGQPLADGRAGLADLAAALRDIESALAWQAPGGDLTAFRTFRSPAGGDRTAAWVPDGRVMGLIAPSNHPTVHLTWVLALAMGFSVALRPGADDPFTPWRVLLALHEAGFPTDRIAFLPGGHDLVPALVECCDKVVAYGGERLGDRLGRERKVLFNGPGRSKVLVDAPDCPAGAAAFLAECIAHDGGRKCTCASGILLRGDSPGLLAEVGDRLSALPMLDPLDSQARIPAFREPLQSTPLTFVEVDGLHYPQPGLHLTTDPSRFGLEFPAPWATAMRIGGGDDPLPLLKGSLAVTLLSTDRTLRETCLLEPSIRKLFTGPIPTWQSPPGAPHNGLLADFLFTRKYCPEVTPPWN